MIQISNCGSPEQQNFWNIIRKLWSREKWYLANQKELLNMRKGCVAAYGLNYCTAIEAELEAV